jgi:protein-L-isoaspartate(D-aspartate) O-methyltransferase
MDCIFAILPERHLNNGAPSLHAKLISEASIKEGDHVVHVGPGTGYYTAIMAHLACPSGRVTAIEFDPALAERARQNLASLRNVSVAQGDGAAVPFDAADVIYVNAGATHPADAWLDGLKEGGRLVLPLTASQGFGNADPNLPIERRGARIPHRAAGSGLPRALDLACRHHPLRRRAPPRFGGSLGSGPPKRRLGACDAPLPQRGRG